MSRDERNAEPLRCDACGRELDVEAHATGWLAFRVDLPDDPPVEIVVYCLTAQSGSSQRNEVIAASPDEEV